MKSICFPFLVYPPLHGGSLQYNDSQPHFFFIFFRDDFLLFSCSSQYYHDPIHRGGWAACVYILLCEERVKGKKSSRKNETTAKINK